MGRDVTLQSWVRATVPRIRATSLAGTFIQGKASCDSVNSPVLCVCNVFEKSILSERASGFVVHLRIAGKGSGRIYVDLFFFARRGAARVVVRPSNPGSAPPAPGVRLVSLIQYREWQ